MQHPIRFPITFPVGRTVDDRLRAVAARHRYELVDADSFDAAYDVLLGFFGPAGEIEPREALRAEVTAPRHVGDIGIDYVLARIVDEAGEVVAAIDGRFVFGPELILGLGSNLFTHPDRRGEGLAAAVDQSSRAPFVERAARRLGRSVDRPRLVAADVDPFDPDVPESLARLRLWGRCGWRVVPPRALPFALLGQQDPSQAGRLLPPVPNLLMVRGDEGTALDALPRRQAAQLVDLLEAIAVGMAPDDEVRSWAERARRAVADWPDDEIRLLPLPGREPTAEVLDPLRRSELFAIHGR